MVKTLIVPSDTLMEFYRSDFQSIFSTWWLYFLLWDCLQLIVTGPDGIKPLPDWSNVDPELCLPKALLSNQWQIQWSMKLGVGETSGPRSP